MHPSGPPTGPSDGPPPVTTNLKLVAFMFHDGSCRRSGRPARPHPMTASARHACRRRPCRRPRSARSPGPPDAPPPARSERQKPSMRAPPSGLAHCSASALNAGKSTMKKLDKKQLPQFAALCILSAGVFGYFVLRLVTPTPAAAGNRPVRRPRQKPALAAPVSTGQKGSSSRGRPGHRRGCGGPRADPGHARSFRGRLRSTPKAVPPSTAAPRPACPALPAEAGPPDGKHS